MIELHSWITMFIYPIVNGVAAILFFVIYTKRKDVTAMIFFGSASFLSAIISMIWLFLRVQKALSLGLVPAEVARVLWVVQAIAEYTSIVLFLMGVVSIFYFFSTKQT